MLVSNLLLNVELIIPSIFIRSQSCLQKTSDQSLHLTLSLTIDDIKRLLRELHTALSGVSVVMLQHYLDDVINLDIHTIANYVVQHFSNSVLIVFFFVNLVHIVLVVR